MIYDLMIVGGGPAGYNAAERASEGGFSVVLFEKDSLGGVCLNEGCVPSKALLNTAKIYSSALHGQPYGVVTGDIRIDHTAAMKNKAKVIATLVGGVKAKLKAAGVTVINAQAMLEGRTAEGFAATANGERYVAKRLLLTTGSVPVMPPITGMKESVESGFAITNRETLSLPEVPERLAVIGGGVIGLEMATYYATAGSKVSIVEMLPSIAGQTDPDISALLQKNLEKLGIEFYLNCKVTALGDGALTFEMNGESRKIDCDKVLVCVGRKANTAGFGIESLGLAMNRAAVITDEHCRTSVAGVWAAGDINGRFMLAHVAYREGEVAVNDMLGRRDVMRYDAVPAAIYTKPEVASTGMSRKEAAEKGIDVEVVKLPMRYSGRYVAEVDKGDGIAIVLFEKKTGRLLGVHMIGSYVSEMVWGACALIEGQYTAYDMREVIFPHPTVSEILREAAFAFKG